MCATAVSSELTRLHVQLQLPYAGWGLMNLTASGLEAWSLTKQPLGHPVNQVCTPRHCLSAIEPALARAGSAKLDMAAKTLCLRDMIFDSEACSAQQSGNARLTQHFTCCRPNLALCCNMSYASAATLVTRCGGFG